MKERSKDGLKKFSNENFETEKQANFATIPEPFQHLLDTEKPVQTFRPSLCHIPFCFENCKQTSPATYIYICI